MTRSISPDTEELLESELLLANRALGDVVRSLRTTSVSAATSNFSAAHSKVLGIERRLACLRRQPFATPVPWEPKWDVGAPMPHVLSSGHRVLLLYYVANVPPDWDGTAVKVVDTSSPDSEQIAIVDFKRCYAVRCGGPNDEIFEGHPLKGRGFGSYGAYHVENSPWIEEQRQINSIHSQYDSRHWDRFRHYLLAFHDDMMEAVAYDHVIDLVKLPFEDALRMATSMLL